MAEHDEMSGVKPPLRLSEQDGNAYMILGLACRAARRAGWDEARVAAFMKEAQAGDYDHLLQTCFRWFEVE